VFEDGDRWFAKFLDQLRGGGDIEDVVIGKLLAVQFFEEIIPPSVKRRRLVRVSRRTAIAQPEALKAKTKTGTPFPCSGRLRSRRRISRW
jgi:hypothetical protein